MSHIVVRCSISLLLHLADIMPSLISAGLFVDRQQSRIRLESGCMRPVAHKQGRERPLMNCEFAALEQRCIATLQAERVLASSGVVRERTSFQVSNDELNLTSTVFLFPSHGVLDYVPA